MEALLFAVKVVGLSLVSLAVSWFGAQLVLRRAGRGVLVDVPNHRSSHHRPTIRAGGVGMALAIYLALMVLGSLRTGVPRGDIGLFAVATVIIAAIGLWDDFKHPPAQWRLFLQLGAAGLVMGGGMQLQLFRMPWGPSISLWWAAAPLTLFWITSLTNLFNFIDGVDGLAASLVVVYSAGIAAVSFTTHHQFEGAMALVVLAACLGFLWFNFPPAKLFMGDVGSLTLGFVLSVLAIRLSVTGNQHVPLAFFLILYSSTLFDTTYTLLRRALRGEEFWKAHRTHLYERLAAFGWPHLKVTLFYVALSLISVGLAFSYLHADLVGRTLVAGIQLLICAGQLVFVKSVEGSTYVLLRPRRRRQP